MVDRVGAGREFVTLTHGLFYTFMPKKLIHRLITVGGFALRNKFSETYRFLPKFAPFLAKKNFFMDRCVFGGSQ